MEIAASAIGVKDSNYLKRSTNGVIRSPSATATVHFPSSAFLRTGHFMMLEQPAAFAAAVIRCLDDEIVNASGSDVD